MSVSASDQDALVAHFASIVNSSDIPACRAMLETHQWKLDEAVATQLAMAQAQMPDHNSPTAATSTQTSALLQPSSSSFNQNNQSHAASDQSMLTERLLPNSASASSASSSAAAPLSGHNFMSHAATVRARGATNAHARPQSVPPTAAAWYTLLPGSAFISRTIAVIASLFQSLLPSSGGATQNRQSPVDAAAQHLSFVHELTQQWPSAPPFVAASYGEAITRAKTRRKPLFIYLHSESAAGTQPFLRDVLCTEGVASFLSANCVSFAGSLSHLSTFRLGQQLRASACPFVALLALDAQANKAVMLWSCAAQQLHSVTADALLAQLMTQCDNLQAMQAAAVDDSRAVESARSVRSQQDAEYEAALENDRQARAKRAKEAAEQEAQLAAERREQEEAEAEVRRLESLKANAAQQREAQRKSLPAEPLASSSQALRVQLRLPNGARIQRRFLETESVHSVTCFVACQECLLDSTGEQMGEFQIVSNFPRKVHAVSSGPPAQQTLASLNLGRQIQLIAEEIIQDEQQAEDDN